MPSRFPAGRRPPDLLGSARPARWSLRTRLLAALVSLLALVCLAVGVVTEVTLHNFLVGRLDGQLTAAGGRSAAAGARPPDGPVSGQPPAGDGTATGARFLLAPGQAAGTLGARITGDTVADSGVLGDDGTLRPLAGDATAVLTTLATEGRPVTRTVGAYGAYRLLATRTPGGDVLITGLPLREVTITVYRLAAVEIAVAAVALAVATGAGVIILRRTLRPLRRVAATASRVATLPLERGEVAVADRVAEADTDPRTEVGQVGAALNRLLDHVTAALTVRQASETRVRQFVADASHELRTPLAAIRGYAELTRRSRQTAPPDLAHAMGRVESEAARMTVLVDDLLLLARLDSGRPLAADPVDLTRLVVDAVSDASAAGPDHRWRLDLPEDPVTVPGDAARLHQVLANLLANARTHTPAGTTVTTSLTTATAGTVLLAVLDDGPGIARDLLPSVFERFARGERSRVRGAGSTGLGLAIVAAIVQAHRGTAAATSRPGQTAFLVRLPADAPQLHSSGTEREIAPGPDGQVMTTLTIPAIPRPPPPPQPLGHDLLGGSRGPVLDVVIPVLNEQADLEPSVRGSHAHLVATFPYPFRITIADNASTDHTLAIAEVASPPPRRMSLTATARSRSQIQPLGVRPR